MCTTSVVDGVTSLLLHHSFRDPSLRCFDSVPASRDGQTDRQTDGRTDNSNVANTGLYIASYAGAL